MHKYTGIGTLHEKLFFELDKIIVPGCDLYKIVDIVDCYFLKNGLQSIELGESVSLNINNVVYHGIYGDYTLRNGDIITVDICFKYGGICIDGAKTYLIGCVEPSFIDLVNVSRSVIYDVLDIVKPGIKVGEILKFINDYVSIRGFYLFPDGLGHGIGGVLHMPPFFSLSDLTSIDYKIKAGDMFTLEPLVFYKQDEVSENVLGEGCISEGNVSSQFEVTIYIDLTGQLHVLNGGLIK